MSQKLIIDCYYNFKKAFLTLKKIEIQTYCSYSYGITDSSELSLLTNILIDD